MEGTPLEKSDSTEVCLSFMSSSVHFASLIRLDISQGFVESVFQKYSQTLITIAYLSASSLE